MVFIAAHLVEHIYPIAPVRQWVLSVPKRLRYFLHRDHDLEKRVLQIFLRVIERVLRQYSLGAPADARFGGVSFVHRFGSALNAHTRFLRFCVESGWSVSIFMRNSWDSSFGIPIL